VASAFGQTFAVSASPTSVATKGTLAVVATVKTGAGGAAAIATGGGAGPLAGGVSVASSSMAAGGVVQDPAGGVVQSSAAGGVQNPAGGDVQSPAGGVVQNSPTAPGTPVLVSTTTAAAPSQLEDTNAQDANVVTALVTVTSTVTATASIQAPAVNQLAAAGALETNGGSNETPDSTPGCQGGQWLSAVPAGVGHQRRR